MDDETADDRARVIGPDFQAWYGSPDKLKVVSAEGMPADIFFKHVRARHRELNGERKVAVLRGLHDQTHELIPMALNHWHEECGLDDSAGAE